jgi:hypothetical protein
LILEYKATNIGNMFWAYRGYWDVGLNISSLKSIISWDNATLWMGFGRV